MIINSNRIKNNKFILNFLDGYKYKFNLGKLNLIENELGKFYIKKNFGLINNNNYTHGNLYFIILI